MPLISFINQQKRLLKTIFIFLSEIVNEFTLQIYVSVKKKLRVDEILLTFYVLMPTPIQSNGVFR